VIYLRVGMIYLIMIFAASCCMLRHTCDVILIARRLHLAGTLLHAVTRDFLLTCLVLRCFVVVLFSSPSLLVVGSCLLFSYSV